MSFSVPDINPMKFSLISHYLTTKFITNEKISRYLLALGTNRMNRLYDMTFFREEERPIDTLSARRQIRVACIARTSVRVINIVIGAQKSVCHTQESYVFPLPQQPLLRRGKSFSSSFVLIHPVLQTKPCYPPPLFLSFISDVPLFFLSFSWSFWPVVPISRRLFSSLPASPPGASYRPPFLSCSALFRAVEIVCPYGGRAAIRRGRSNEKGGVNGISRGRHGHRCQR